MKNKKSENNLPDDRLTEDITCYYGKEAHWKLILHQLFQIAGLRSSMHLDITIHRK